MPKDAINWHVSTRKQNNKPMKTWAKDGNRDFCQEDRKRANGCMNTCSPSLSLRPMQMQTAREGSDFMTGQVIAVDGGALAGGWWEPDER